jgi:hypothetical protein
VATLEIDDSTVTVRLSVAEKLEAVHGDVTLPRTAVVDARAVDNGMAEVHGLRFGTGLPGVIMVGTWRSGDIVTFAVCHGRRPAVVLDLAGHRFSRMVVTVDNPREIVDALKGG